MKLHPIPRQVWGSRAFKEYWVEHIRVYIGGTLDILYFLGATQYRVQYDNN